MMDKSRREIEKQGVKPVDFNELMFSPFNSLDSMFVKGSMTDQIVHFLHS
jgi:hypothetical protein